MHDFIRGWEPVERPWSERQVRSSCLAKRPYETRKEAETEYHRILRQDPGARPVLNIYSCKNCGKLHIGRSAFPIR